MSKKKTPRRDDLRDKTFGDLPETDLITVCDRCARAACWQGIFMCDDARTAGTTVKTVKELRALGKEHESYWRN